MQTVTMRNGAKRRKATTKRRNTAKRTTTTAKANPVKRRKRRNPVTTKTTAMVRRSANPVKRVNPKRRKRRARNGSFLTKRNGVFTGFTEIMKSVALGGAGALATGVIANSANSLLSGVTSQISFIPGYVMQAGLEIGAAMVPVKWVAEKILSTQNANSVVAGGLIKAGITLLNGFVPSAFSYNPLNTAAQIVGGDIQDLGQPYSATGQFAGANEGYAVPSVWD